MAVNRDSSRSIVPRPYIYPTAQLRRRKGVSGFPISRSAPAHPARAGHLRRSARPLDGLAHPQRHRAARGGVFRNPFFCEPKHGRERLWKCWTRTAGSDELATDEQNRRRTM